MVHNIFFISDTHFGHEKVCQFLRDDGSKLRPFSSAVEMDEHMVEQWNAVVRPCDKVYHLGDVVINRKALPLLHRLNGTKVLVKGNHDIFPLKDYIPYFKDVRAYHKLENLILSHIPIHPDSLARWPGGNIHGHLHEKRVLDKWGKIDPRYVNVAVEQINYTPIELTQLREMYGLNRSDK